VEDSSKLALNRSMESFANIVALRSLDSNRYWLNTIVNESSLKRRSSRFGSLVMDNLNRSGISRKPSVFEMHCDLFARSVIDSNNFAKETENLTSIKSVQNLLDPITSSCLSSIYTIQKFR
jgi:hypothetical protein